MTYKITDYSYKQAEKLGVQIKPSVQKSKKIDVFKGNKKIASIGDIRFFDFPSYLETKGKQYAEQRRKLYKKRHKNDINKGAGFYADKILW
jgi:hypothetical protein